MTLQVIRGGVIVQSVALAQHTATMHVGSAARAAADGVASLDGSGDVPLGQVPDTLTGKDADTLDGSHAGNAANKIPILDGSALLPLAQIPATLTGKDADTVDGEEAADIVTDARVKAHFPDTTANVLSDHDKAAHDALNIDADTLDGSHAANSAGNVPVLDGSGLLPNAQVPGLSDKYAISSDVLHSHDAEESFTSTALAKEKEITLDTLHRTPETIRIYWESKNSAGSQTASQIYKNGAPHGGLKQTATAGWRTWSEDLVFADGDTVELWAESNHASLTGYVQNFRIQGTTGRKTLAECIDDSDIGLVTPLAASNTYP